MELATTRRTSLALSSLLFVSALSLSAFAKIIHVDDDATGANDGTSWVNAYVYLQDALADANASKKPVEIRVAQGLYKPDQGAAQMPGDREATFRLINGVTLRGGYAGIAEPDPDARDVAACETILSGDLHGDDVEVAKPIDLTEEPTRGENSYHVVTGSNTDETAVLDGFTTTGGNANGGEPFRPPWGHRLQCGSGMYNYQGSPTLTNCTFIGNLATWAGGGMHNEGESHPTLTNCTFSENSAYRVGGGMYNYAGSSPTLTNCTFSRNSAIWVGGGMHNKGESHPTLTNCTFIGNLATWAGGGMENWNSSPTLTNCIFNGNSVEGDAFTHGGGGMYNDNSSPTLTNCTFSANSAYRDGGGMYNYQGSPTLTNCTFAQNSAEDGNALACNSPSGRSNVELVNCILWDGGNEIWNNDNSTIIITYSNIQGGFPGEGNIDADPLFIHLGYWDPNGTPADESDDYWVNGDYHLRSLAGRWDLVTKSWVIDDVTSPCIDAGDPNSPVAFEPSPNGARVNMGAYGGTAEASKSPSGLHAKYGGGTGEPNDPYLIYTAEHLNALGAEPNDYDKHFKLMADIDLDPNLPGGKVFDRAVIAPATLDRTGWGCFCVGSSFMGVLDGNGHAISHVVIAGAGGGCVGLFGNLSNAEIKNLRLVDVNITALSSMHVGSLAGSGSGTIANCYSTGTVSGEDIVGGLVGKNWGRIATSNSTGMVSGSGACVGGLVGYNSGNIAVSCSAGTVGGDACVGGLAGRNKGDISTSYSSATVRGDRYIGGLVGYSDSEGNIAMSYSTGLVRGNQNVGGLVGEDYWIGSTTASFWDMETSGQTTSATGIGLTTAEMQTATTYLDAGWDFVDETDNGTDDIWWILEGQDYPRLWWEAAEE